MSLEFGRVIFFLKIPFRILTLIPSAWSDRRRGFFEETHMKNPSNEYTNSTSILHMLVEQGPDAILELFRIMMNEAMKLGHSGYLNALPYQRSEQQ